MRGASLCSSTRRMYGSTRQRDTWFAPGEHRSAFKNSASKRKRWTVIHAGTLDGWVEGGDFFKVGQSKGDFHGAISAEIFFDWLKNSLIPKRGRTPHYICMDNASFHRKIEYSRSKLRKADIIKRLEEAKVEHDPSSLKEDLLELMDEHVPVRPRKWKRWSNHMGSRCCGYRHTTPSSTPLNAWGVSSKTVYDVRTTTRK